MLTKEKNRAITTRQVRDLNERETTIKTELTTILQAFLKSCTKKKYGGCETNTSKHRYRTRHNKKNKANRNKEMLESSDIEHKNHPSQKAEDKMHSDEVGIVDRNQFLQWIRESWVELMSCLATECWTIIQDQVNRTKSWGGTNSCTNKDSPAPIVSVHM